MNTERNKLTILKCIELYNKCTLEWVDTFYSKKLEWIEQPKHTTPQGRSGGFEFFRKSAGEMLYLFPDSKLSVLRSVAENDCVVLEQEWQGTAAHTIGNFSEGRTAKLRVATFFILENDLIIKQIDYCTSMM